MRGGHCSYRAIIALRFGVWGSLTLFSDLCLPGRDKIQLKAAKVPLPGRLLNYLGQLLAKGGGENQQQPCEGIVVRNDVTWKDF